MKLFLAALLCLSSVPLTAHAEMAAPLTCLLRPEHSSAIGSDAGGIVAAVAVQRADHVEKGDLLVQIDDRIARAQLAKITILRDNAHEKLERAEKLTAGRVISAEDMAGLRADAASAQADFERAQLELERARITAPFAGTVARIATEEGELIGAQPLMELIDTSRLRAEIAFPAEAFGTIAPGDMLPLKVDLTGAEVRAEVATIDDYIDPSSNSFTVIAEIDNRAGALPAGTSCTLAGAAGE